MRFFTYSNILHHLLLTRFLVACQYWSKTSAFRITEKRISYELARTPPKVTLLEGNRKTTLSVIPDAWVKFDEMEGEARKSSVAILFELDRGMEHGVQFKQHVRSRIEFVRSGVYQKTFGVPGVLIAYATTGQTPEYRHTRARTISKWTMEVLDALKLKHWAALFRFAAIEFDSLYAEASDLFEKEIWLRPDMREKVRLFD